MIMAQKTSRSKSRSKSKSGGRREKRGSGRGRSGLLGKNSKGEEGAVSGRKDEGELQLETVVILKLGWISKSAAEDIKKWIESFGGGEAVPNSLSRNGMFISMFLDCEAVESEEVESEKLTVTGKVDTKRLRETVSWKTQLRNKIDVEKSPKEAGGSRKDDDGQNDKNNGKILKKEVERSTSFQKQRPKRRKRNRRKIQKEEGRSRTNDDSQNKNNNGKTHGEEDRDLDTVVVLKLGLNSESFGADIQKWISSFGAVESKDCMSGTLTVTGRVDAKTLGEMLSVMASNTDVPGGDEAGLATHGKLPKNPDDTNF